MNHPARDLPEGEPSLTDELGRRLDELQLIVDAIPACIWFKDANNRVVQLNRAAADMIRVTGGHFNPDSPQQREADLEALASGQPRLGIVEEVELPGRGKRWLETTRLPQFDATGGVRGIVVIAHDITDRKQLEEGLLQAQKLESIGRLAGGVAHDFNNLLTSIFGLIGLAQRSVDRESMAHEYLALLQLAAEGGANLTKQLLAFARRQMIAPQVVDLNALVLETANLLQRVLGENIELRLELASGSLAVRVDANQISQLLMNLSLNARDAMPNGGELTFRTAACERADVRGAPPGLGRGRHAVLTIADTGFGLSDEARAHLFEPFFTTKSVGKGTGLGLAMCYGIVKQNGGHIQVQSERGAGTTFTVYLPQLDADVGPISAPQSTRAKVECGHETILFVEDDDLVRSMAVTELARQGYRVIEAGNGEEAMKAAAEHAGEIHLLVTDVVMPKLGGLALARRLRKLRPDAAVLFISGYAAEAIDDPELLPSLLLKPFTHEVLLARVRRAIDEVTTEPARSIGRAQPT